MSPRPRLELSDDGSIRTTLPPTLGPIDRRSRVNAKVRKLVNRWIQDAPSFQRVAAAQSYVPFYLEYKAILFPPAVAGPVSVTASRMHLYGYGDMFFHVFGSLVKNLMIYE